MTVDTITMPRSEFAAYQRAIDSAKSQIARLTQELTEARQRERAAVSAYTQQQAELEAAEQVISNLQDVILSQAEEARDIGNERDKFHATCEDIFTTLEDEIKNCVEAEPAILVSDAYLKLAALLDKAPMPRICP
jgi:predicted  nucleic acid-binding Zn-ribbon protein